MKCFNVYSNEIEGRLDCFFYQPEFVELEKKVKEITNNTLEDYIISISSGATPNKNESDKYYTDSNNGIAFLRVQNITNEGLKLNNCKFINRKTHINMLKRSQVKECNLITKITGVGRMAVSAVAPPKFVGNINQHLVVIKTESYKISKVLATFLNSDIGERLAFRRSTGGTRPALDYKALKTIPIVFKPAIVEIMESAYRKKKQKEVDSKELLDSINNFVLGKLGIKLPKLENKKCFVVNSNKVQNYRIDAYYYQPKFEEVERALGKSKYTLKMLKEFITKIHYGASVKNIYVDQGIPLLRILNLRPNTIDLQGVVKLPQSMRKEIRNAFVSKGDLLISRSGSVGIVSIVPKDADGYAFGSFMIKFCINNKINKEYVSIWLNTSISKLFIGREKIGAIQGNITIPVIETFKIPIPPLNVQQKIADEVKLRMQKTEKLQQEAKNIVEKAEAEVERMILS